MGINIKMIRLFLTILFVSISLGCSKYEIQGKTTEEIYNHFYPVLTSMESGWSEINEAIDFVEEAYKLYPKDAKIQKLMAQGIAKRARLFSKQEKYFEAEQFAKRALELDKGNIEAYGVLSSVYKSVSDIDASIDQSKKILAIDSKNYDAAGNIGYLACVNNKHQEALKYSLYALEIFPENPLYEEDKLLKLVLKYCVGYSSSHIPSKNQLSIRYLTEFTDEAVNFTTFNPLFPKFVQSASSILEKLGKK
ncbi:tetratricopeptide repeat protein [Leptospira kmetyi]|uniref:Tetratricopeptide repeat protein n=1 Tax=Leptospira kmetyi TaxID=408139 RepID=A0ABX4N6A6_9LEPT|nr:hypothetical protein [Leptospira kmetyi]PJZ28937.1 hypothetical protein CH378_15400 [Leptospira kmetyi]